MQTYTDFLLKKSLLYVDYLHISNFFRTFAPGFLSDPINSPGIHTQSIHSAFTGEKRTNYGGKPKDHPIITQGSPKDESPKMTK